MQAHNYSGVQACRNALQWSHTGTQTTGSMQEARGERQQAIHLRSPIRRHSTAPVVVAVHGCNVVVVRVPTGLAEVQAPDDGVPPADV